jgi:hypothetical protein
MCNTESWEIIMYVSKIFSAFQGHITAQGKETVEYFDYTEFKYGVI